MQEVAGKQGLNTVTKSIILCILLAILLTVPFWASEYIIMIFLLIFLYMSLGHMWNLLAGYAGLVSLGQQIFIGLGGYSLAVLTELYHLPFVLGILVGGLISVVFALIISQPIFKMKGVYFTIGSWIVAEALAIWFSNWAYVKYGQGFNITSSYGLPILGLYYLALIVGIISFVVAYKILRTKMGLALMSMRDNDSAAETMGVELYKTKLRLFLITSFITGITGGALYMYIAYIQPFAAFSIDWTVAMVFMVIIGGIGTLEGPVLGAILYVILKQYLYNFPGISMIILGLIAIVIILIAPRGIMGTLHDKYGFEILSPRRRVRDMKI